ncbi:MAG: ABC transporter ATP-binding protein [Cellvibrionaceae bacterium]
MTYLVIDNIVKTFGHFSALNGINIQVDKGAIQAVLGENGAGKTTLMNILFGLYRPDSGRILIDNKAVEMRSPRDAIKHGIGMIHQHFHLANSLTVTENIVLGLGESLTVDLKKHEADIQALSEEYGFDIDSSMPVWKLPMGMRQRVEILKALYRKANILVLDEPTSILAPDEINHFLDGLKRLAKAGHTILFVTHKLDEVKAVSDSAVIMRQGNTVATANTNDVSVRELSKLMVGRETEVRLGQRQGEPGKIILKVDNINVMGNRDIKAVKDFSCDVRAGEVLGITGVDGNGQQELAEAIVGLRPLLTGEVFCEDNPLSTLSVKDRLTKTRIGFVPEDRHTTGLVLDYSVANNFFLRSFDRPPAVRYGLMNFTSIHDTAKQLINNYDIRLDNQDQDARNLSGGNQQKIILAREIEASPKILVIMQATKGLDVGAIEFVQNKILEQRAKGVAILYISTELEHLLEVADRVGVMCDGRLSGVLAANEVTTEDIGLLMGGVQREES